MLRYQRKGEFFIMNIQPVTPSFTGDVVYRVSKSYMRNASRPYFEYEVLNVLRKQDLPANIKGNNFDVSFDKEFQKKQIKIFKDTLDEAGITFKLLV